MKGFKYDTKKYLSDLENKHLRDVQENTNKLLKEMARRALDLKTEFNKEIEILQSIKLKLR